MAVFCISSSLLCALAAAQTIVHFCQQSQFLLICHCPNKALVRVTESPAEMVLLVQSLQREGSEHCLSWARPQWAATMTEESIDSAVRHYSVSQFSLDCSVRHTLITALVTAPCVFWMAWSTNDSQKVVPIPSLRPPFTTFFLLTELRKPNPPTSLDDDCTQTNTPTAAFFTLVCACGLLLWISFSGKNSSNKLAMLPLHRADHPQWSMFLRKSWKWLVLLPGNRVDEVKEPTASPSVCVRSAPSSVD